MRHLKLSLRNSIHLRNSVLAYLKRIVVRIVDISNKALQELFHSLDSQLLSDKQT